MTNYSGILNVNSRILGATGIGQLGQTFTKTLVPRPFVNGLGVFEDYHQALQGSIAKWQPATSMLPSALARLQKASLLTAAEHVEVTDIASRIRDSFPTVDVTSGVGKRLKSIDSKRLFRKAVDTGITDRIYENFLSSTGISRWSEFSNRQFQSAFLDSIENEHWRRLFDSLLDDYSPEELEEELEEVATEPQVPEGLGLFHERVQEQILNAARWLEEDFPHFKAKALDGANTLIALCLWMCLMQLGGLLTLVGGTTGLVMAAAITGTVKVYDDQRRKRLGPRARRALDYQCPCCQARINMWCITLKGALPGSNAHGLHEERIQLGEGLE